MSEYTVLSRLSDILLDRLNMSRDSWSENHVRWLVEVIRAIAADMGNLAAVQGAEPDPEPTPEKSSVVAEAQPPDVATIEVKADVAEMVTEYVHQQHAAGAKGGRPEGEPGESIRGTVREALRNAGPDGATLDELYEHIKPLLSEPWPAERRDKNVRNHCHQVGATVVGLNRYAMRCPPHHFEMGPVVDGLTKGRCKYCPEETTRPAVPEQRKKDEVPA